jgi:hypothetical protein
MLRQQEAEWAALPIVTLNRDLPPSSHHVNAQPSPGYPKGTRCRLMRERRGMVHVMPLEPHPQEFGWFGGIHLPSSWVDREEQP